MNQKLLDFRYDRLAEAAKKAGYDAVVASCANNINFLSDGYTSIGQSVSASTQIYVVFDTAKKSIAYVVSVADVPNIIEHAGVDADIYCYGNFVFEYVADEDAFTAKNHACDKARYASGEEALAAAVKAVGGKAAFDETHINFVLAKNIAKACGLSEIEPASAIFREARKIKSPEEAVYMKKSAEIAENALLYALSKVSAGDTEEQLERWYREACVKAGAQPYFFVATAGYRAAFVDAHNTDYVIKDGDMLRFDFGCLYNGYYSDLARTAVIGKPDEKITEAYDAVIAGYEAAAAVIKPGITAGEIFDIAMKATRENGIPTYARSHVGHGIGLEGYDLPSVAAGVPEVIKEGMILCIETPYYRVGWGGVQIEHTIYVTADGFDYLDSGDNTLIVVTEEGDTL